jgi:hypothetical protein
MLPGEALARVVDWCPYSVLLSYTNHHNCCIGYATTEVEPNLLGAKLPFNSASSALVTFVWTQVDLTKVEDQFPQSGCLSS